MFPCTRQCDTLQHKTFESFNVHVHTIDFQQIEMVDTYGYIYNTYIPFVYYINVMSVYCFSTDGDPNCLFSVTFNFWNENSAFFLCFSICILIFLWNNVWRWWKFKCKCGKQNELVGVTIANISHWFYSFSHLPPTSWHS